jgi:hypothetical protein
MNPNKQQQNTTTLKSSFPVLREGDPQGPKGNTAHKHKKIKASRRKPLISK